MGVLGLEVKFTIKSYTHTHIHKHRRTHTQTIICARARVRAHTHAHAHARTFAHTHTHTHISSNRAVTARLTDASQPIDRQHLALTHTQTLLQTWQPLPDSQKLANGSPLARLEYATHCADSLYARTNVRMHPYGKRERGREGKQMNIELQ